MTGTGGHLDSLRLSRREMRRLMLALGLSLAAHLFVWGGYELGKELKWWRAFHLPVWLHHAARKSTPPVVAQNNQTPLIFLDVNSDQATPEAPKHAKYYSAQNSHAASAKETQHDTETPQINGHQTEVVKTETVRHPDFNKLQPASPPPTPPAKETPETTPKELSPGDLTLGKPDESLKESHSAEQRPHTLKEALARLHRMPGLAMQQEGGTHRHLLVPSFDAEATPFGAYDAAFIQAVTQRWYDLLDSQQFSQDRTGKVTLRFHLNYDGSITDMKILDNTVGDLLAYVCEKAVSDPAPYAPWPSNMRETIGKDYREITFTFYYY